MKPWNKRRYPVYLTFGQMLALQQAAKIAAMVDRQIANLPKTEDGYTLGATLDVAHDILVKRAREVSR